jgi:hypothetical protein
MWARLITVLTLQVVSMARAVTLVKRECKTYTRPGNDLPLTDLNGGIFGASVTDSSFHEDARM